MLNPNLLKSKIFHIVGGGGGGEFNFRLLKLTSSQSLGWTIKKKKKKKDKNSFHPVGVSASQIVSCGDYWARLSHQTGCMLMYVCILLIKVSHQFQHQNINLNFFHWWHWLTHCVKQDTLSASPNVDKKVLPRERKRHTDHYIASARYAALSSDGWGGGGTPSSPALGGYPIPGLGRRCPIPGTWGVLHPRSEEGAPPSIQTWNGVPPSRPGQSMVPHSRLVWMDGGTPCSDLGLGTPTWTWDGVPSTWDGVPPPVTWMGYLHQLDGYPNPDLGWGTAQDGVPPESPGWGNGVLSCQLDGVPPDHLDGVPPTWTWDGVPPV